MMTRWLTAVLLLIAAPLTAYTIYLKDGSRLIAREKYTLEGDRALIVLQNGTLNLAAKVSVAPDGISFAGGGDPMTLGAHALVDRGRVVFGPCHRW